MPWNVTSTGVVSRHFEVEFPTNDGFWQPKPVPRPEKSALDAPMYVKSRAVDGMGPLSPSSRVAVRSLRDGPAGRP